MEEARFFDDIRTAAKALTYAESDAIGTNAYNEKHGGKKVAPPNPRQLAIQEVKFTPEEVETFTIRMSIYPVEINVDDLNPMSEMGNRELTTWRGVKNKSLRGRHITDGTLLIDKKHVADEELFEKLTDRKSDKDIDNDRIKALVSDLKDEKQWVGKIRGQKKASKLSGMGTVKSHWVAVVGYRNYKNHCLADAQAVQMANKLMGESADLKVGNMEVLTWWKYGVPAAAVATWDFFEPNVQS